VVLAYFGIPRQYQFRVLFWGIFGAFVFRAALIFAGVALIEAFDWLLYFFGAFLIFTAFRIARQSEVDVHPESNVALRLVRKVVPSTNNFNGQHLFTVENGKRLATPLFAALIIIETTDIVFAIDSIPAILAVTREQFIVFSSNAFAILGLRALYFGLADLAGRFRYLNTGLGVILGFVGVKMLLTDVVHIPTWASLAIIPIVLTVSIVASIRAEKRDHDVDEPPGERETVDATRNPD
jgi:TerC family integral membrane protein